MKLFIFALSVFLIGCGSSQPKWSTPSTEKISPIVSVFMNKYDDYTVFVQQGKELKPCTLKAPAYNQNYGKLKIYADVPKDEPMYAIRTIYKNTESHEYYNSTKVEIDLHLHSPADLNGGQWEERSGGKFPKTTTGRVRKVE